MGDLICVGIDAGFRKTGLSAFALTKTGDEIIAATTIQSDQDESGSVVHEDVKACWSLLKGINEFLSVHKPVGIFVELPNGGAQGARAHRCMGIVTGLIVTLMHERGGAFEFYAPVDVEKALGVYLTSADKKARGLKKGQSTAAKKESLKQCVIKEWPLFNGWPERESLAEDAYDSAAAFMCGRANNDLYKRIRGRLK